MATSLQALSVFLDEHRIPHGDRRTATITGYNGGKYSISDDEYTTFLDLVYKYLHVDKGRPMNIIEQPLQNGPKPLTIDLDFSYSRDRSLAHPFNSTQIQNFLEKLVDGLNTFFDLSGYEALRFFVCLRPQGYEKAGVIRDGIHIQCPDIVLSFEKQGALRRWVLSQDSINQCFKDTGFLDKPEKAYDESCTRKQGWFLYGESKPQYPPYELKTVSVYNPSTDGWSVEFLGNYDDRELLELLSVRYNISEDSNDVKEEVRPLYDSLVNTSPAPAPIAQPITEDDGKPKNILVQELEDAVNKVPDTTLEDIDLVKRFVRECLSAERADGYDTWKRVGWCLHNIAATDDMFNLWMEFSAKSGKSASNDMARLKKDWELGMRKEGDGRRLTMRSLRHWAKEDNPGMYHTIIEKDLVDYVLHHVMPTHNHVARLMKRMFQDQYRCSIETRATNWYEYNDELHQWKRINQGVELRNKISIEVADMVMEARNRFKRDPEYTKLETFAASNKSLEAIQATLKELVERRRVAREQNKIDESIKIDGEIKDAEASIDLLTKRQELARADVRDKKFSDLTELENKLYNSGFKDSVMKECAGLFYEEGFEQKLNNNPHRIGCANGVIHLDRIKPNPNGDGTMVPMSKEVGDIHDFFEKGRPDDYLTFQAGRDLPEFEPISYYPYDPSDPLQGEITDFFKKLFPRPELREWVDKKLLPSCLEGKNREQCYYTFQGVGGNGKSKLIDLMVMTLGDYQSSLASTALTRKRPESGAANPDLMSIKNKRFIYMQEPDDREPLNTSRMKQFSGEDAVEARGLYADQERFKICGKLFMMCNNLPPINTMDRGTWRRVRLIPFESKFVSPGDKEIGQPNVYLKDMNLNAKLKRWRGAFLSRLVYNYYTYYAISDNGTLEPAPEVVTQESMKYRESFDSYARYRYSRMRVDRDSDEQTTLAEIWRSYKYWLEAVGGVGKRLTQNELNRRLEDEFGKPSQGKYYRGVVVFNTDEDVEEYDNSKKLGTVEEEEEAEDVEA
jgi:phage/plasmid-associated DNA primase